MFGGIEEEDLKVLLKNLKLCNSFQLAPYYSLKRDEQLL